MNRNIPFVVFIEIGIDIMVPSTSKQNIKHQFTELLPKTIGATENLGSTSNATSSEVF